MGIAIRIIGFGTHRPACFADKDQCVRELQGPVTPTELLVDLDIEPAADLIVLHNNTTVAREQWRQPILVDGDQVTLMTAIEGG